MEPLTCLDAYNMVEAIAAQDRTDGIALGEHSWPAMTQLLLASIQPPSLDATSQDLSSAFSTETRDAGKFS